MEEKQKLCENCVYSELSFNLLYCCVYKKKVLAMDTCKEWSGNEQPVCLYCNKHIFKCSCEEEC